MLQLNERMQFMLLAQLVLIIIVLFASFQQDLLNMCNACKLKVCKETINEQEIIFVLGALDPNFCNFLHKDVIATSMRQTINRAENDAAALGSVRDVSLALVFYTICIIYLII